MHTYNFSIIGLLKEGFRRTDGEKWNFIGALLIYVIIGILVGGIFEIIFPKENSDLNSLLSSLLSMPITLPIIIGITMLGIKQARGERLEIPSIFNYFNMLVPIILAYFAMTILMLAGVILLVLPGLYLLISYTFTYALIIDKGLGVWEAMELSRKTVTTQWFKFFGLALISGAIILISIIPFGIGLIWTVPMTYISYGLLYHHLFDEED